METPSSKICTACLLPKPLEKFRNDKYRPDGKSSKCRECLQKAEKQRYDEHPERGRQRTAHFRERHPDKIQAYEETYKERKRARRRERYAEDPEAELMVNRITYQMQKEVWKPTRREWSESHRDLTNASSRRSYRRNRENILAKEREDRRTNPEKAAQRSKQIYARHGQRMRAASAAWLRAHPDIVRERRAKRRAAKANAPVNDLTNAQWLEIQEAQAQRCYYCGKRCKGRLTQDHLTPISKGGAHTLHNVIGVCHLCNAKKGTKTPPVPVQPLLLTVAPAKPRKPKKEKAS